MTRPNTYILLRHLITKTNQLGSKIITSLRAGIDSCACETHGSQQNGRSGLLQCRTVLSQQGSTLMKMKRMTFVSCQQAGAMTQSTPKDDIT